MKAKDLPKADLGIKPNFDFFDFRVDLPDVDDKDTIFLNESFYVRESALLIRAIKSYAVKLEDMFLNCVQCKSSLIDNEEFEFYYAKVLQALMDLRLFQRNLNRKLK